MNFGLPGQEYEINTLIIVLFEPVDLVSWIPRLRIFEGHLTRMPINASYCKQLKAKELISK